MAIENITILCNVVTEFTEMSRKQDEGVGTELVVLIQKYWLQIFKHHHDKMPNTVKLAQKQECGADGNFTLHFIKSCGRSLQGEGRHLQCTLGTAAETAQSIMSMGAVARG